jgi:hypothetical protein
MVLVQAYRVMLSSVAVALIAACGGGGSDSPSTAVASTQTNAAPIAVAGAAQAVEVGATVALSGSASSDPNGDSLTFAWILSGKPAGSVAALMNPSTAAPTFVPDVPGNYAVSLTVSDGRLTSAASTVSVTAVARNQVPLANSGAPQTVVAGSVVTLDGSGSADPNGDALSYVWTLSVRPSGSAASLSQPTTASPTFQADVVGTFVATLVVSDGKLTSAPASVAVTAISAGGTGAATRKLTGKVIDGYVVGATVFADFNYNGTLDAGEPSTVSTSSGKYELILTAEQERCAAYAPLVVDVPVGAIDEELGVVKEAYQMILPPKMKPLNLDEAQNVSPLTSLIWNVVGPQMVQKLNGVASCSTFLQNQTAVQEASALISGAISDVIRTYAVTEAQLYDDYVASLNADSKTIATDTVPILAKSLSDTLSLRQQYPAARHVRVTYLKGSSLDNDGAYPDAWYRQVYVFDTTVTYFSVVKVSADLNTDLRTIILGQRTSYPQPVGNLAQSFEFESRRGDGSPYGCDSKELFSVSAGGISYEIVNLVSKSATRFEDCAISSFASETYRRYIFVGNIQYIFTRRPFDGLNDWFDLLTNLSTLNVSALTTYADSLANNSSCVAISPTTKQCN